MLEILEFYISGPVNFLGWAVHAVQVDMFIFRGRGLAFCVLWIGLDASVVALPCVQVD